MMTYLLGIAAMLTLLAVLALFIGIGLVFHRQVNSAQSLKPCEGRRTQGATPETKRLVP